LEWEKIDEEVEKRVEEVCHCMEASHANLCTKVKELKEWQHHDKWAIFGLLTHIREIVSTTQRPMQIVLGLGALVLKGRTLDLGTWEGGKG